MKKFTADFETATWLPDETYVWAYALCEIGNPDNVIIGNNIDDFMKFCEDNANLTLYFHNLKFDGQFILSYLFNNGYELIKDRKEKRDKTFNTLISDMGLFYSMEIFFEVKGKKTKKVTLIDSLKILNMSVSDVAKSFGLPISKLELDYDTPRERGYQLKDYEKDYITNDVKIMALALDILFKQELTYMTAGSNALHDFKKTHSRRKYARLFPELNYKIDQDMRQAYKGGFTYLNPKYKEKDVGKGVVLDVNSLYPSVMYEKPMPIGEPIFYEGKYEEDRVYPLYIQQISCAFEIKPDKIPTIQIKGSYFIENEYLESSQGEIVTLVLSNVDLKLFLDQYNVYEITYECGWKFKAMNGIFTDYIDKWIKVKIEATREGNKGMRQIAKIALNSLYGKFATSLRIQGKFPYIDDDGIVKYYLGDEEDRRGLYLPIGIFITSYAREKTIRTSQSIKDYSIKKYGKDLYYYSDTDSIYTGLSIEELKQFCEIDDVALGKWKHEATFDKAHFVRQKCLLKSINGEVKITCAGMPKECYKYVEWKKFKQGFTCGGKLTFKYVKGGVKLVETNFTIKYDKKLRYSIKNYDII